MGEVVKTDTEQTKAFRLKNQIFDLVKEYHSLQFSEQKFVPGLSHVPVSGKVFDHNELNFLVDSALDGWFTTGRFNKDFEKRLARFIGIGVNNAITVNSGSSANLVAFSTLTDPELGERAIKPGDEVITVAASFPTTINPMVMYGVIPVFLDVHIPTYNIDVTRIEEAITPKTKGIMIAHTLGNPFNLGRITEIAKKYNLWLVEDCCDALGATYEGKHVGTFGDLGTLSFYPAHHITMGEGGAVFTKTFRLKKIMESFRDWGRDCYCDSGKDNTCMKRFGWQLGSLPFGYDHKYTYSRLGYNLKITDMQAALGLAQLDKLPDFVSIRRKNFEALKKGLSKFQNKIILPEATPGSDPSWFGFLITIRKNAGITRNQLIDQLTEAKIGTRLLFAGDLRKQPYFQNIKYRTVGDLVNTETILTDTFWVGVTPMINEGMIDYMVNTFEKILK
jgi:CDP-6-deoxy-D-xylo-4-hexulose-3-dehydrase